MAGNPRAFPAIDSAVDAANTFLGGVQSRFGLGPLTSIPITSHEIIRFMTYGTHWSEAERSGNCGDARPVHQPAARARPDFAEAFPGTSCATR